MILNSKIIYKIRQRIPKNDSASETFFFLVLIHMSFCFYALVEAVQQVALTEPPAQRQFMQRKHGRSVESGGKDWRTLACRTPRRLLCLRIVQCASVLIYLKNAYALYWVSLYSVEKLLENFLGKLLGRCLYLDGWMLFPLTIAQKQTLCDI